MTNQQGAPEAPSYEHQRAIMEGERNASLDAYSRVVYLTQTESRIYEAAFTNGWNRLAALVEAQQPAPSAAAEVENLRKALQFYADKEHFAIAEEGAWDTVSGEPQNYWCDEAGTAMVEDGSIAKMALAGQLINFSDEDEDESAPPTSAEGVGHAD